MNDRLNKEIMTEKEMIQASLSVLDNALTFEYMSKEQRVELEKEYKEKCKRLKQLNN